MATVNSIAAGASAAEGVLRLGTAVVGMVVVVTVTEVVVVAAAVVVVVAATVVVVVGMVVVVVVGMVVVVVVTATAGVASITGDSVLNT